MKKIILFSLLWLCLCLTSCHEVSVHFKQAEDINKIHEYYLYVYGDEFTEDLNGGVLPENLVYEYVDHLNLDIVVFPTAVIVNQSLDYELTEKLNLLFEKGMTIIFFNVSTEDNKIIFSKQFHFCEYNSNSDEGYFNLYFDSAKKSCDATDSRGTVTGLLLMVEKWLSRYK
ncbi:MAG: hypothetical protein NC087_05815 [Anaeroplasma bactoclasticum]|nr:hypothetical protein [Anaeroplasma bactoclasticum]MCM1557034.1 hypothetical protein [Anaeroplasma bactoclasticum]